MKKSTIGVLLICLCSLTSCCTSQIERAVDASEPKVVKIGIVSDEGRGVCSGSFITPTGIVLTCAHCFDGAIRKVFIKTSTGLTFLAQPLLIDRKRDLALIAPVVYMGKFKYFRFGSQPKIGQQVISMGSPLGVQHTVGVGYIANIIKQKYVFILHSAFINPGNSGGPLVDLYGQLVGVNEAMISVDIFTQAQGLFVAIDMSTIRGFLK